MKIYKATTVFEESLNRIRWLYDEFDDVVVSFSGGKDSVIVYQLALIVARERNRLPLKVLFLDQEAEFQSTIDLVEEVMTSPDVEPYWYQIPMKIFNATSNQEVWIHCWEEGKQWMRERVDYSIHENTYGTDRFKEMFTAVLRQDFLPKTANIGGVRTEESPARFLGLTGGLTYKGETWGKVEHSDIGSHTFYPIYDWSYTDVWKAIHDNGWSYCKIYDKQYAYGIPVLKMRVSSLCHETSVANLEYLHEAEKETYNKLTERLSGIATEGKFGRDLTVPSALPYMFESWMEYRDYLFEHMVPEGEGRDKMLERFTYWDDSYGDLDTYHKVCIDTILKNDYHFTILDNFRISCKRKFRAKRKIA